MFVTVLRALDMLTEETIPNCQNVFHSFPGMTGGSTARRIPCQPRIGPVLEDTGWEYSHAQEQSGHRVPFRALVSSGPDLGYATGHDVQWTTNAWRPIRYNGETLLAVVNYGEEPFEVTCSLPAAWLDGRTVAVAEPAPVAEGGYAAAWRAENARIDGDRLKLTIPGRDSRVVDEDFQ